MQKFRKLLAAVLILTTLYSLMPNLWSLTLAATIPVNIYVNSYDSGNLVIKWDSLPGTVSARVSYHVPNPADPLQPLVSTVYNQTTNTAPISGLLNDYIYDIRVELYNASNAGGNKIGDGFFYFIPQVSFTSKIIPQSRSPLTGGGYETGNIPKLNLGWTMPQVWNGSGFDYANKAASLSNMQSTINGIYNSTKVIGSINFRINISTDLSTLNSGSAQSAILVNEAADGSYAANVSGNINKTASIDNGDLTDMNLDVAGRADSISSVPAPDNADLRKAYYLPDSDILPGTVYYMNVKLVFKTTADATGTNVSVLTVGPPAAQNGSMLQGLTPYVYTPIRFQLTKDSADNIYVKIFKINQGSLDLPRLFYEVQASDDPSVVGDWPVKKTIDDSFFAHGAGWAITVISGINPNNEVNYKVVVKSDSPTDRIESLSMPYTIASDTDKPPLPKGVSIVNRNLVSRVVGNSVEISTDITVSWEKPTNWDTIKNVTYQKDPADPSRNLTDASGNTMVDESGDIFFHFLISTSQSDMNLSPVPALIADGKSYGNFQPKYRLEKYVSAHLVTENGNHLEYTIKGFELFKGEHVAFQDTGGVLQSETEDITNAEDYPDLLLPNMTYYVQMYTTKGTNRGSTDPQDMSDKSITTSFTTLNGIQRDVPLPLNFKLNKNDADPQTDPSTGQVTSINNYIVLEFGTVSLDWSNYSADPTGNNIYYDLYMSTRTDADSFTLIGSSENPQGSVAFDTSNNGKIVTATVKDFAVGEDARDVFGAGLRPNTTYYFLLKTRLSISSPAGERTSQPTSILPVTTVTGTITPPDDSARKPLTPIDFAIAKDTGGNLLLTGSTVAFSWQRQETDVEYDIICTKDKVAPDADESAYQDDPVYQSFTGAFNGDVTLDPGADPLADNFEYNAALQQCKFTVDKFLFPNRLYYFSIKAVNKNNGNSSSWVSIPVTTNLIDPPTQLGPVNDAELGFFWTDTEDNMRPEDYKIYLKGPNDKDYQLLTRGASTVVKDGVTYYGRIRNLKANTAYDIQVYKGSTDPELVYEETGTATRDSCHEIEVKWTGLPGYKYELDIKTADATDYTMIQDSDLEEYTDTDGNLLPYYPEKTQPTTGTDYYTFYAKIKQMEVTLPDGTKEHQPLTSNMKYYIKVRAVKVDDTDTTIASYSKFIGPVNTRTEFNQQDYDDNDDKSKDKATFLDKISQLEENLYWRVNISDTTTNKLLLRGDKMENAIENSGRYAFTLDISKLSAGVSTDEIYVPEGIISVLNNQNRSLIIKTSGTEFTFRPKTMELEKINQIKDIQTDASVKDIFFRLTVVRTDNPDNSLPDGVSAVSKVNSLQVETLGTTKTDSELKDEIHDKLYNKDTGLVSEKTNELMSSKGVDSDGNKIDSKAYITELVGAVESDLSDFIGSAVEGSDMIADTENIDAFNSPLIAKLAYTATQGVKFPYVYYNGTDSWQQVSANLMYTDGALSFNAVNPGTYAIGTVQTGTSDVKDGYWAKDDIGKLTSKYDLRDIFGTGTSFYPESNVTVNETVLLYEKLAGKANQNTGMDMKQKIKALGLDGIISSTSLARDVERQEAGAVMIKLYALKLGVNADSVKPKNNIILKDEAQVGGKYYKSALLCVDLGLLAVKNGSFSPRDPITRAEMVSALVKLLKFTGDM